MGDRQLIDLVHSTLDQNPHLSRRQMRIEAEEGHVVLRGVVKSWYHKQMAQEALRQVVGVRQIENQLEVSWCQNGAGSVA